MRQVNEISVSFGTMSTMNFISVGNTVKRFTYHTGSFTYHTGSFFKKKDDKRSYRLRAQEKKQEHLHVLGLEKL